ncbi:C69 family dipeptidase [Phytoactinopolyspora limicola]|uniref:C69 family dipeptidase n=1 Tax=Phytoactinopolyspora limicola TaxID=2715536 RepID=UPI001A9C3BEF|nr:C69 family dipeptidase [Phytoactinopolyspora limicola]
MQRRLLSHVLTYVVVTGVGTMSMAAMATATDQAPPGPVGDVERTMDGPWDADPDKSIAFYVGKNHTADGQVLIGGFGHEPSSHWVEIVPRQSHPEGSTVTVGATEEADMPGQLSEIPQVSETARYITSNYSEFAGFPAPLTNGGLNEHNVAARDVWSNSREELWDMTPLDQTGPSYSDLSRIAMERATTARQAVEILGELIDEHGYTTYGGNSHMFADEHEGWIFIQYSGGEGLWAAERLGPDDVRVSYPGYIREFPVEAVEGAHPDFLGSANLVSFAVDQGWYDPESDEVFDLQAVYQQEFPTAEFEVGAVADPDDPAPYRNPISLEAELEELAPVTLEDMMRLVRDPRWSDDRSGYGHVAELRDDLARPELATLWVASTAAVTAPYIPIAIGTDDLPVEYTQHRYLTSGAAASYLNPEYAEQEATEYATQTYKRLMYATCARPEQYLAEVTAALEGFEADVVGEWPDVLEQAEAAYEAGDDADAARVLTEFTANQALDGLALANYLLDSVLERSRADGGLHVPDADVPDGTTASSRSLTMELDGVSARDRMNCDVGGGWADGSTLDRQGNYGDPADVPDFDASDSTGSNERSWAWIVGAGLVGIVLGVAATMVIRRRTP